MTTRLACALAVLVGACAGPSAEVRGALTAGGVEDALAAYERAPSPDALASIAAALLEGEAIEGDRRRRDAAFGALASCGTYADDVLERLATADSAGVRGRALALLARHGDVAARHALAGLVDSDDPEARAAAVEVLDPVHDRPRLLALVEGPVGDARLAAVRALGDSTPDEATRLLLTRVARQDPRIDVRTAAVGALVAQAPDSIEAIETRLEDPERAVRFAAIAALVTADPALAGRRLDRWLATDPSPEGIEAARLVLAKLGANAPPSARAQLARALEVADSALRAQAAVALSTLDDDALAASRLAAEKTRDVRLSLALALGADDPRAHEALASLMAGTDVAASQAAAELARHGNDTAREKLLTLRTSDSAAVRRTVMRALGRDLQRVHDIREALLDADRSVRIAAAAAILVGAS